MPLIYKHNHMGWIWLSCQIILTSIQNNKAMLDRNIDMKDTNLQKKLFYIHNQMFCSVAFEKPYPLVTECTMAMILWVSCMYMYIMIHIRNT